jgi:hypothetical protein
MMVIKRKSRSIADSEALLRDSLWKDADDRLWKHKEAGGFFTVPKTMPYIARLMDETAKNTPISSTYMALWSFTWSNDGFVKLGKILDIVYAAGFNGERGIRTLRDRLTRLEKLGFIELRKTGGDQLGYVYIPNPHKIIIDAMRSETPPFRQETYSSFIARALEIGAKDVKAFLEDKGDDGDEADDDAVAGEPEPASPKKKTTTATKRPRRPARRPTAA